MKKRKTEKVDLIINKKISFACIVILCITCLLNIIYNAHLVYAQTVPTSTTGIYNDIDIYLQSCVENAHIPAMSVTIVDKDKVLFSQSYGSCESCDTPFGNFLCFYSSRKRYCNCCYNQCE